MPHTYPALFLVSASPVLRALLSVCPDFAVEQQAAQELGGLWAAASLCSLLFCSFSFALASVPYITLSAVMSPTHPLSLAATPLLNLPLQDVLLLDGLPFWGAAGWLNPFQSQLHPAVTSTWRFTASSHAGAGYVSAGAACIPPEQSWSQLPASSQAALGSPREMARGCCSL